MMLARIAGGRVAEVFDSIADGVPIEDRYPPEFIAELHPVPAEIAGLVRVGWQMNEGGTFMLPEPVVEAPALRRIWPLSFRDRLGDKTRAALTLAASSAMEKGDPSLQVFLDDLAASRFVELDNPRVIGAVAVLVERGLLTEAEGKALLADPRPEEMEGLV